MAKGLIIVLWNGIVGDAIKIRIVASTVLFISEILWYIIEFRALLYPACSVKAGFLLSSAIPTEHLHFLCLLVAFWVSYTSPF